MLHTWADGRVEDTGPLTSPGQQHAQDSGGDDVGQLDKPKPYPSAPRQRSAQRPLPDRALQRG